MGLYIQRKDDKETGTVATLGVSGTCESSCETLFIKERAEFVFDFCRVVPGVPKANVQSRIIIAPMHAKPFLNALQENIRRYESQYGSITMHQPKGDGGPEFPPPSSSDPVAQA